MSECVKLQLVLFYLAEQHSERAELGVSHVSKEYKYWEALPSLELHLPHHNDISKRQGIFGFFLVGSNTLHPSKNKKNYAYKL